MLREAGSPSFVHSFIHSASCNCRSQAGRVNIFLPRSLSPSLSPSLLHLYLHHGRLVCEYDDVCGRCYVFHSFIHSCSVLAGLLRFSLFFIVCRCLKVIVFVFFLIFVVCARVCGISLLVND
jgi:hypothetical protein